MALQAPPSPPDLGAVIGRISFGHGGRARLRQIRLPRAGLPRRVERPGRGGAERRQDAPRAAGTPRAPQPAPVTRVQIVERNAPSPSSEQVFNAAEPRPARERKARKSFLDAVMGQKLAERFRGMKAEHRRMVVSILRSYARSEILEELDENTERVLRDIRARQRAAQREKAADAQAAEEARRRKQSPEYQAQVQAFRGALEQSGLGRPDSTQPAPGSGSALPPGNIVDSEPGK